MQGNMLVVGFLFCAMLVSRPAIGGDSTALRRVTPELPAELLWVLFVEGDPAPVVLQDESTKVVYTIAQIPRGTKVSESWRQGCGDGERLLIPVQGNDGSSCTTRYSAFVIYRFDGARRQVPDFPLGAPLEYRRRKVSEPMFVALNTDEHSRTAEIWAKEGLEEELFIVTEVYGEILKKKREQQKKDEGRTSTARFATRVGQYHVKHKTHL